MLIETKRLTLKPYSIKDLSIYHAIFSEYNVVKMTETIPWPFTLEVARDRLMTAINIQSDYEQQFGIFKDNKLIGGIGLHRLQKEGDNVNKQAIINITPPHHFSLGYHLSEKYWGQGYVSEAVIAMMEWARSKWDKPVHISAGHYEDNPASGKILEKAGFVKTGENKPIYCQSRDKTLISIEYELQL